MDPAQKALWYVESHLADSLTLDEIAAVRRMLTSPSLAGLRVHSGEIVGAGNWPAILTEQTWRAVVSKLDRPR